MAESGCLSRSLEQPYPYTLKYPGKIKNPELKKSFLDVVDYIQKSNKVEECIKYLIFLVKKSSRKKNHFRKLINKEDIDIRHIISFLEKSFFYDYKTHGESKIPVIAMHSIFSILI